jgi:hypothetical protein
LLSTGGFEVFALLSGLTKATFCFQRFVVFVLGPLFGKGVEVYLDDILVHSVVREEHVTLLNMVFSLSALIVSR